jgi:hypothetical protein
MKYFVSLSLFSKVCSKILSNQLFFSVKLCDSFLFLFTVALCGFLFLPEPDRPGFPIFPALASYPLG